MRVPGGRDLAAGRQFDHPDLEQQLRWQVRPLEVQVQPREAIVAPGELAGTEPACQARQEPVLTCGHAGLGGPGSPLHLEELAHPVGDGAEQPQRLLAGLQGPPEGDHRLGGIAFGDRVGDREPAPVAVALDDRFDGGDADPLTRRGGGRDL